VAAKGNEGVSLNFILDAQSEGGSIEKFGREWRKEENYRQEIKFKRKSEKWKRERRMTNFLGKIQTCLVNSFLLVYTNIEQPKHGSR
jgi:hypothetical protein